MSRRGQHIASIRLRNSGLFCVILLALWCVAGGGCQHALTAKWTHKPTVDVAPELRRIGRITVHEPPSPFFTGFSLATLPVLSEKFTDELATVIRTAVERSGGTSGIKGAPDLDVFVEECGMVWRVTGVITSVTKVRLRGRIADSTGAEQVFVGEGDDSYTAFSAVVSMNAEEQLNRALGQAVAGMLADRSGAMGSNPYLAELTAFRRTLAEQGQRVGRPAFGTGMTETTSIIAYPSRNALAQGLVRGDVVEEWNGMVLDGRPGRVDLNRESDALLESGKPLKLKLRRDGTELEVQINGSSDSWGDSWKHSVEREDWREALRILDVSAHEGPTAMTPLSYLGLRRAVIRLLDLRQRGSLGTDSLYASVALLNESLDQAMFDPELNRQNRAFLLETVDFARTLHSDAVVDDLTRRLEALDRSVAKPAPR